MKFEFDPIKSEANKVKHGLSLECACELWHGISVELQAKTVGEPRSMLIGKMNEKLYSCIFTKRGSTIRLISARRSRKSEEKIYYEHIKNQKH